MSKLTFTAASSVFGALILASACTSIVGDGFVIEDEDDETGTTTGGAQCADADLSGDCEFCLECFCAAPIDACSQSANCSLCLESGGEDPNCDFFGPEITALLACFNAACPNACA